MATDTTTTERGDDRREEEGNDAVKAEADEPNMATAARIAVVESFMVNSNGL